MNLQNFNSQIPNSVSSALSDFEKNFTYPLGTSCRFGISHGEDYLRFFRSMGEATLLVVGNHGCVDGSIARVKRSIQLQRGLTDCIETGAVHYLCDLKVRAKVRGSMALPYLIRETKRQIEASETLSCYCVVMDGTGRLPNDYTGRLGVPKFLKLGEVTILRLSETGIESEAMVSRIVDQVSWLTIAGNFHQFGYRPTGGERGHRSMMDPIYLTTESGDACGILEDTRRAKRLITDSGDELLSAHFSDFRYKTPAAGGALLLDAVALARSSGMPAVFTAIPSAEWPQLQPYLTTLDVTEAPATIYGNDLEAGHDWWIDTAEI